MLPLASACSSGAPETTSPSISAQSQSTKDKEPFGKYDTPIDITMIRPTFPGMEFPEGMDIQNNNWITRIKNELGINIKYLWTTNEQQYQSKLNVTIASGILPDISVVYGSQLKQLADAGQLEDLTQVYNDYAAPFTKEMVESDKGITLNTCKVSDKIYGMPNLLSSIDGLAVMWIRQDWLDKLNLKVPKTMDDFYKVSTAFAQNDPDGNGKNDTIGLSMQKDFLGYRGWGGVLYGYFNGANAYPNIWVEKDSKVEYGSIQPEMKEPLKRLQKMYADGEIDREFAVKDLGKMAESVAKGQSGIAFGSMSNSFFPLGDTIRNNPKAEWRPYAIPTLADGTGQPYTYVGVQYYYAVKKGFANPEALVKLMNYAAEKTYGKTSTQKDRDELVYNTFDDGKGGKRGIGMQMFAPVFLENPTKNVNNWRLINDALEINDTAKLNVEQKSNYSEVKEFIDAKNVDRWGTYAVFGPTGSQGVIDYYVKNNLGKYDVFWGSQTPTMVSKLATLTKLQDQVFTNIIMGASIDEFDKFVTNWKTLGGDQITQEVNDWYKTIK